MKEKINVLMAEAQKQLFHFADHLNEYKVQKKTQVNIK